MGDCSFPFPHVFHFGLIHHQFFGPVLLPIAYTHSSSFIHTREKPRSSSIKSNEALMIPIVILFLAEFPIFVLQP